MTRRLGTPLLSVASVLVLVAFVGGAESGVLSGLAVAAAVAVVLWAAARWLSRRLTVDGGWVPAAAVAYRPATPHAPYPPARVAVALGRAEARELAVSASFGVGLGLTLLVLGLFGGVWAGDWGGNLPNSMELNPLLVHPLVGMVVLAAHRARTRGRRDGTQELFESCPTNEATRTVGHLLTAAAPVLVLTVFLGALTLLYTQALGTSYGRLEARQLALLVGPLLLAIGGTALGVALARWAPWGIVPVAAIVAVGFASVRLATRGASTTEPLRQLSTWLGDPEVDVRFTAPHWAAHHLWILALVGLVVVVALARDGWSRRLGGAAVITVAAAVIAGVAATRPIDAADADRIAALLNDPGAHQDCVDASGLPVCAYEGEMAIAHRLAAAVAPVAAAAPEGALDGWAVRQGYDVRVSALDPEVRARLLPGRPSRAGLIPMEITVHPHADQAARLWTAFTAVGITDDHTPGLTLGIRGQARGVVALWLATRDLDEATARKLTSVGSGTGSPSRDASRPWPDQCFAGPMPVTWAVSDVEAARQLLAVAEAQVARALAAGWDHLTHPDTPTDELLAAVGLPPMGPPRGFTPPGDPC